MYVPTCRHADTLTVETGETVETVGTMETMETVETVETNFGFFQNSTISILVYVHSHKDMLECRPVGVSACQHVGTYK